MRSLSLSLAPMLLLCIGVAAALLSGCANLHDADHRYEDGWRYGVVAAIDTAHEITAKASANVNADCRSVLEPDRKYAVVWYRTKHSLRTLILPFGEGVLVKPKDRVMFRPGTCMPLVPGLG